MRVSKHPTRALLRVASATADVRTVSADEAIADFVISTRAEDRYGSIIEPSGIDLTSYLRNPIVLWCHDSTSLPIGRTLKLTKTDTSLTARIQFAVRQNAQAATCFALIRDGFLSGTSIGFIPLESTGYEAKTTPFGENARYTRVELLEVSVCPVPANREALLSGLQRGVIPQRAADVLQLRSALSGFTPQWHPSDRALRAIEEYFGARRTLGK